MSYYELGILVDGAFFEASANNIMYRVNGNKGVFVLFQGDFLQLHDLQAGNNTVENLLVSTGIGTLAMEIGNAAAQAVHEGIGDFLVLVGNDHDSVGFIQALQYHINHLGDDEIGY